MDKKHALPSSLQMGCVNLNVKDLQKVSRFYELAGLDILKKRENESNRGP